MSIGNAAPQQRATEVVPPLKPAQGLCFIRDRFIAPDKPMALEHQSPKKIFVLPMGSKGRIEQIGLVLHQSPAQKHIPAPSLVPLQTVPGLIARMMKQAYSANPIGHLVFKMGLDWT